MRVGIGESAALVARYSGTGDRNMYLGVRAGTGTGTGYEARIWRNVNGTRTLLSQKSLTTNGAGTLRFEVVGSSLKLFWNGTLVTSTMDNALTSGSVGIRDLGMAAFDNFSAAQATQTNSGPALAPIADQTMATGKNTLAITLSASDADGKPLTFSARTVSATNTAYQLKQQLGLSYAGSEYQNAWGLNEKWLLGAGDTWYLILPNGELRRWTGDYNQTMGAAGLAATLPTAYYADPSLLYNAANQTPTVAYSFSGNQLTIHRPAGFAGSLVVQVTVSDGSASATRSFTVTVG